MIEKTKDNSASSLIKRLLTFAQPESGSVAIITALSMTVLLMLAGLGIDYGMMIKHRSDLQAAADSAAIAGARELTLVNSNQKTVEVVTVNFAKSNLEMQPDAPPPSNDQPQMEMMMMKSSAPPAPGSSPSSPGSNISIESKVDQKNNQVGVEIVMKWKPFFAHFFSNAITPIRVKANAKILGTGKICVVGLMPSKLAGIHLDNEASLLAKDCGVYSNSTSIGSIRTDSASSLIANLVCTAGGYLKFGRATVTPKPVTDCPEINDPLSDRKNPSSAGCTKNNLVVSANTILNPGTYCGGLKIEGTASVTLRPGNYIIKDGPLHVADSASFKGVNVGFYLTGSGSLINFEAGTTISLTAPKSGDLAGVLFFEDRNVEYSFNFNPFFLKSIPADVRIHRISSNDARQLLGTIYLSRSILLVDAEAAVADESAYTAIVVARLWLQKGPKLVLNADYAATDVPVPSTLIGGKVYLSN